MSVNDKVDIVIFGATGFTGKIVVRDFICINESRYTWAIAGRNPKKLQEVLEWASVQTGQDATKIPIIISDCQDEASLDKMTKKARIIINCCGPYRFYGEPVIKACIENGAHQVDFCAEAEVEYMETIQLNYHEAAEKKEVYIVNACGFESVPCDFGVIHLVNNFQGQVNSVECFLKFSCDSNEPWANIATWESIVDAVANLHCLETLRKKLHPLLNIPKLEPRLKSKPYIHRCDLFDNDYTIPYPKSDHSVVFHTQMFLRNHYGQRPVQYRLYGVCLSLTDLITKALVTLCLLVFSKFKFGRMLLLRYPEFFSLGLTSREGPSEECISNASAHYKFKAEGWTKEISDRFENKEDIDVPPNKKMVTECFFKNPYNFTSKAIIHAALVILQESDKMPSRGGVYTPGGAFYKTSFFDQLTKTDVLPFERS